MTFTAAEKLECVDREIRQRQQVYPRRVASGKMSQAMADKQIALMRAIADDYRARIEPERLTRELF